jgi:hypothetical protein
MSDHEAYNEKLEFRLPADLAECELRLARLVLPQSSVDRDQLLYEAGWEAALAQRAPANRRSSGASRRTVAWSLASGVVAASLAAVITLQTTNRTYVSQQQARSASAVNDAAVDDATVDDATVDHTNRGPLVTDASSGAPRPAASDVRAPDRSAMPLIYWSASLLTQRDRALWQHSNGNELGEDSFLAGPAYADHQEPRDSGGGSAGSERSRLDPPDSAPHSTRELLRDYLPRELRAAPASFPWPWTNPRAGVTS